ncbi:MAG: DUF4097 family beta strand repeat-containing protein [Bacteroidota bacterium]
MIPLRIILLLEILLLIGLAAQAQEKIQVVTKTIQKQISWQKSQQLTINAEKATILIKGWNQDAIQLTLKLVAKHPKRSVAEQDLSVHQYAINLEVDQVELTNFFRIPESRPKIRSNLQAVYELTIPQSSQLVINNRYGNISLADWQGDAAITASFGEVQLDNVRGEANLNVNYGDIFLTQADADITADTKKTNIIGYRLAGTLAISCAYGEVEISTQDRLTKVTIDASRTEVSFATTDPMYYYYVLEASSGRIQTSVPGKRLKDNLFLGKETFESYQYLANQPTVFIKTSYSAINIKKQQNNATKTTRSAYRP